MDALASRLASTATAAQSAGGGTEWWQNAGALAFALSVAHDIAPEAHYRFGDAHLAITAPAALRAELSDRYGDCAVPGAATADAPAQRCTVRARGDGLTLLHFTEPAVDAMGIALALLEHPVGQPLYREVESPLPGWRLVASTVTGVPLVAARGGMILVDAPAAPDGFLPDLLLSPVLAMQRELLFVHAASLDVGGRGVLLIGPSGSGKTTTALTLAARGHGYLSDDMAVLNAATGVLMPLRSTANLRPGPHPRALADQVQGGTWEPPHADGQPRLRLRVTEVFPDSAASRVPLAQVLFLRRFADHPAIEPFDATPDALGSLAPLGLNKAVWLAWGTTPQRRLAQFMVFMRLLARVRCAWLDVGPIETTADLIERTMEDSWH
jgi:hypothetical protein